MPVATPLRIDMFSGPRNISTTMMRAFENRDDCAVVDEPFYASYLRRSGARHPAREETLAAQPQDAAGVLRWLKQPAAEFGKPGAAYLFCKHIAYHLDARFPLDWLLGGRTFLLIRDPARMIQSYAAKSDAVAPVADSFRISRSIFEYLERAGRPCPVVDAADVLADPEGLLLRLCAALDIPYSARMLSWPAGTRPSDGPWAPHWYDAVRASTGFRQSVENPVELTGELAEFAERLRPDYAFLRERRLSA